MASARTRRAGGEASGSGQAGQVRRRRTGAAAWVSFETATKYIDALYRELPEEVRSGIEQLSPLPDAACPSTAVTVR
jgi:hypothetical protein